MLHERHVVFWREEEEEESAAASDELRLVIEGTLLYAYKNLIIIVSTRVWPYTLAQSVYDDVYYVLLPPFIFLFSTFSFWGV
jgi:hypothetical protein